LGLSFFSFSLLLYLLSFTLFLPSLLSFFLSSLSPDHRHLHFFPTRRSSDLSRWKFLLLLAITKMPDKWWRLLISHFITFQLIKRSEEHTSELQSRFDLVCRLLLEKKKKFNGTETLYNDKPFSHHTQSKNIYM